MTHSNAVVRSKKELIWWPAFSNSHTLGINKTKRSHYWYWYWHTKSYITFIIVAPGSDVIGCLIYVFKYIFSIFKQHYTYFYITFIIVATGSDVRGRLVYVFKHIFSIFKQYYTYFHTFFHPYVFSKNTNNVIRTTLPNEP